jgi:WD40 repeat protein
MLTTGSDGTFKIWDITTDVSITAPILLSSNVNTGLPIRSCRFYIDNYIMVGDSSGKVNIYYPNGTVFQQWTPSYTGVAYQVDAFVCKGVKFFLTSSNQKAYFSNDTQPFYSSTGQVYVAKVDLSDNFIAVGDSNGILHIQPTANFKNI